MTTRDRAAGACSTSGRRSPWLVLAIPAAIALSVPSPASTDTTCDTAVVRAHAQRSFPEYQLEAVRTDRRLVTLLFTRQGGASTFAVAVRVDGKQFFSSIRHVGLDESALSQVSRSVHGWYENAELQQALARCTPETPGTGGDPDTTLRKAADRALQERSRIVSPRWSTAVLGGAWVAFALLLFASTALGTQSRREQGMLVVLFGYALLLNWGLGSGGPGDLRLNLAPIWDDSPLELRWGPAPVELFRLLALVLGSIHDTTILRVNLLLSSAIPCLTYGIVRQLGAQRAAAMLAAWLLATHPLLIAFANVLERQPTYLFAAFGSIWALLGFLKRGGPGLLIAFVLGTILAVGSRPEGAHVFVPQLVILLLVHATWQRRGVAALALALLAPLSFLYLRYGLEYGAGLAGNKAFAFDPAYALQTVLLHGDFTPVAWIGMWLLGLVVGVHRRAAWIAMGSVAGLHAAWAVSGLYNMFIGYERQVASARYETILLLPFAIGAALCIERILAAPRWLKQIAAVLLVATTTMTFRRPYETLLRPFTVDYEYRFLKRHVLALPAESRFYVLQSPIDDLGFIDAPRVGEFVLGRAPFDVWDPHACDDLRDDSTDAYLYVGSSCAPLVDLPNRPLGDRYADWLRECDATRTRLAGSMVEETEVPAHKMSWHDFREPTVRLGLYRLEHAAICAP